jgi:Holliday junction resolvasome RuvABC DNA-binding subunit
MSWFPPRPRRKAGETFWDWLSNLPPSKAISDWWNGFPQRLLTFWRTWPRLGFIRTSTLRIVGSIVVMGAAALHLIFGWPKAETIDQLLDATYKMDQQLLVDLASVYKEAMQRNPFGPVVDVIIETITNQVFSSLAAYQPQFEADPKHAGVDFAKIMARVMSQFAFINTNVEPIIPGVGQTLNQAIQQSSWALGLGFLGWQALAPFLRQTIQVSQENWLNYHYPKETPAPSTAVGWFAERRLSEQELYDILLYRGIPQKWHQKYKEDGFKRITTSDLFDLYESGKIDTSTLASYLAALGYKDEDITLIIQARTLPKKESVPDISLSVLRQALREGVLSEDEFRKKALAIPRNPEEVELIILIERTRKNVEQRLLTVAQIKEAFRVGTLKEPEVRHYLRELGLSDEAIDVLVRTWKEEFQPKFRSLNAERLTQAYAYGVITEQDLYQRLLLLGWPEEDVKIWIQTVKARLAEKESAPTDQRKRKPTTNQVLTFMLEGIISQAEAFELLKDLGYDETTAKRLIQSALYSPPKTPRKLSRAEVIEAWKKGFMSTPEALSYLESLEYQKEEAETLLFMEGPALGESDLLRAWRNGIISTDKFIEAAVKVGYRRQDVERLVRWLTNPIRLTEVYKAWKEGVITKDEAQRSLINMGYPLEEIQAALTEEA